MRKQRQKEQNISAAFLNAAHTTGFCKLCLEVKNILRMVL